MGKHPGPEHPGVPSQAFEHRERGGVEGHDSAITRLGRVVAQLRAPCGTGSSIANHGDARVDDEPTTLQIVPAQGRKLGSPSTGDAGEAHRDHGRRLEDTSIHQRPCCVQDAAYLRLAQRTPGGLPAARQRRRRRRVVAKPPPPGGKAEGSRQHEVLVADGPLTNALLGEPDVPRVHVWSIQPCQSHRGDRVSLDDVTRLRCVSAVEGAHDASEFSIQRSRSSATVVRAPRAVLASASSSWATRRASRLVPLTVLEV